MIIFLVELQLFRCSLLRGSPTRRGTCDGTVDRAECPQVFTGIEVGMKRCPHGRRKDRCAECSPCPHGKVKKKCAECSGCPHGKRKSSCVECTPCLHGKVKYWGAECSGCPHGKLKYIWSTCKALRNK